MHTECQNIFCSECIKPVENCPLCRGKNINKNSSSVHRYISNKLNELKVECSMCKGVVSRGDLKDHQEKYCTLLDAYKEVDQLKLQLQQALEDKYQEKEILLKQEKEEFDKKKLAREKLEMINKPIHLNVQGVIMTVSLGDFIHNEREPDNLLKKMFNGEYPLYQTPSKQFEDPIYFIDCDPIIFKYFLDWLKFGNDSIGHQMNLNNILNTCSLFKFDKLRMRLQQYPPSHLISQHEFFLMKNSTAKLCLTYFNMSNLTLRGLDMSNSKITFSKFSGMDLTDVVFAGSDLRGCDFSGSNLTNTNFTGSDLRECNFTRSFLKNTDLTKSDLSDTSFEQAIFQEETKFMESKFERTKGLEECKLIGINFSKSTFNDCSLKDSNLSASSFSQCTFSNCNFEKTNLNNTNFESSEFIKITFKSSCKMEGTVFSNCSSQDVSLIDLRMVEVDFSNAIFISSEFRRCDLSGCKLESATFQGCVWIHCTLTNTSLYNSTMSFTKFNLSKIVNCLANFLHLESCSILQSSIEYSNLESSNYNKSNFLRTNLLTTSFSDSKLSSSSLCECKIIECDWTRSTLLNATINECEMVDSKFEKMNTVDCIVRNCKPNIVGQLLSNISKDSTLWKEICSNMNCSALELIYSGSRDGFKACDFHSRCDNQGSTFTIIKSEHDQIFGGFTTQNWISSPKKECADTNAFIFKVSNGQLQRFNIKTDRSDYAIYSRTDRLVNFGGGHDFSIATDCNFYSSSYSDFGNTYDLPNGFVRGSAAKCFLAGSEKFKVSEIEIFKVYQNYN